MEYLGLGPPVPGSEGCTYCSAADCSVAWVLCHELLKGPVWVDSAQVAKVPGDTCGLKTVPVLLQCQKSHQSPGC